MEELKLKLKKERSKFSALKAAATKASLDLEIAKNVRDNALEKLAKCKNKIDKLEKEIKNYHDE